MSQEAPGLARPRPRRRSRLVGRAAAMVAAVSLLGACGVFSSGSDEDENLLKVQTMGNSGINDFVLYWAEENDYFKKAGLDLEFATIPTSPGAVQALLGGHVDVITTPAAVAYRTGNAGSQMKTILGNNNDNIYSIMVADDFDMEHDAGDYPTVMEDLRGARIGVPVLGGDPDNVVAMMLADAGLKKSDVTMLAVGGGASGIAAFNAGRVDALVTWEPSTTALAKQGGKILVDLRHQPEGVPADVAYQLNTFVASTRALEKDDSRFETFVKVMKQADEDFFADSNVEAALEFIASSTKADAEGAKIYYDYAKRQITPTISCAGAAAAADFVRATSTSDIKVPEECSDYVWSGAEEFIVD